MHLPVLPYSVNFFCYLSNACSIEYALSITILLLSSSSDAEAVTFPRKEEDYHQSPQQP